MSGSSSKSEWGRHESFRGGGAPGRVVSPSRRWYPAPMRRIHHGLTLHGVVLSGLVALAVLAGCTRGERAVRRPAEGVRSLVIRNVHVFGAPKAALMVNLQDVVVRDGRITEIEPNAIAEGLPEINGKGGTLLPGLVDLHTHTGSTSEPLGGGFALPDIDANLAGYL